MSVESLATTSSQLATITSTLKSMGIYTKVCKDPTALAAEVTKAFEEQLALITEQLDNSLAGFDFYEIVGIAASILAAKVGGVVEEIYDELVNEFLIGKIGGSILSLVSMIISAIPGAIMFIQYQMVRQLADALWNRQQLLKILRRDVKNINTVLMQYMNLFNIYSEDDKDFAEIEKALKPLNKAIAILAIERSKAANPNINYVTDPIKIKEAEKLVDSCINELSKDGQKYTANFLNRIHRNYNLTIQPPTLADAINPSYWVEYFTGLIKEIQTSFTAEEGKRLIYELFPMVPKFVQLMLIQSQISDALLHLNEKTPTVLGIDWISQNITLIDHGITRLYHRILTGEPSTYDEIIEEIRQPDFFTDEATKNLTIQNLGIQIEFQEMLILTSQTTWGLIKEAGRMYEDVTLNATQRFIGVRDDMLGYKRTENTRLKTTGKKLEWIANLGTAKAFLTPITSDFAGITQKFGANMSSLNGLKIAKLLEVSQSIFEELQELITANKFDEKGEPKKQPIEISTELSNIVLPQITVGSYFWLPSTEGKTLMAKLKSIELIYKTQRDQDRVEYSKALEYIEVLNNSQTFGVINSLMKESLGNLQSIQDLNDLIDKALTSGDLTGILNITGNTATTIENIVECFGGDINILGSVTEALMPSDLLGKTFEEIETDITQLKQTFDNTGIMFADALKKVDETMAKLAGEGKEFILGDIPMSKGEEALQGYNEYKGVLGALV